MHRTASVIGLGCWQLGADWGDVDDAAAMDILRAAADAGVTFFDTADAYGDGRSERFVARLLQERAGEQLFVATKVGRRAKAQIDSEYTERNLRSWVDRSLTNLGVERLDLVQWHCPPTETFQRDDMYQLFDELTREGKIAAYGVSVETVEQARIAIAHPNIASVQIIANPFRLKPFETVIPEAAARGVGVIVGPNGSGKSNIAEALCWAMASQAPSEVRVATGLDVLFSGSESRAAAGVAEVELVLEDEGGVAPGGRPELSVLRRLSRDGESQYHLNRVPVRRLDVHEVLADIGLGKDSHAIIGQNQVETVLLATPSARQIGRAHV